MEEAKVNIKAVDEDGDNAVHIAAIRLEKLESEPKERTSSAIYKVYIHKVIHYYRILVISLQGYLNFTNSFTMSLIPYDI